MHKYLDWLYINKKRSIEVCINIYMYIDFVLIKKDQ